MGKEIAVGARFGRLTVVMRLGDEVSRYKWVQHEPVWLALCDCGSFSRVRRSSIGSGTSSCGCLQREAASRMNRKHGMAKSHRLYGVWCAMKRRCTLETVHNYERYGGRGITVCDEWRDDYAAFHNWAISNGWAHGLQIDRIDNDGNYTPENCRFVDCRTNVHNSGRIKLSIEKANRMRVLRGRGYMVKEIAEMFGVAVETASKVLNNKIWTK